MNRIRLQLIVSVFDVELETLLDVEADEIVDVSEMTAEDIIIGVNSGKFYLSMDEIIENCGTYESEIIRIEPAIEEDF